MLHTPVENQALRSVRYAVRLKLLNAPHEDSLAANLQDLSTHGAFIETVPKPVGTLVEIQFAFPGQVEPYRIISRVVWARRLDDLASNRKETVGMGVHFIRFESGSVQDLFRKMNYWGEIKPVFHPASIQLPTVAELRVRPIQRQFDEAEIEFALNRFFRINASL